MKNIFSPFFVILIFLVFSCTGAPKSGDDLPDSSQSDLIEEEVEETQEPEAAEAEPADEQPDELLLAEDFFEEEIEPEETAETEEIIPEEDIAAAELLEQDEPAEQAAAIEAQPMSVVEPVRPPPQPPVQIVQEPVPAPAPSFPLPVPPPALLGPAEEKPPAANLQPAAEKQPQERQGVVPFRPDPAPAVSAVRDNPPVPSRSGVLLPQDEEIIFSRTVRATVGQIVEIPFRGTGWVYLGELASRRGIVYDSRRLDPEGQSFIFRTEEVGAYALKFYKQDFIRDYILNDYVQVIVGEAPSSGGAGWFNPPVDRGRVVAQPRWPSALEEAEIRRSGSSSGSRPAAETSAEPRDGGVSQTLSSQAAPPSAPPVAESAAPVRTAPVQGDAAPARETVYVPPPAAAALPPLPEDRPPAAAADDPPASAAISEKQENLPPNEILKKAQETFDEGNVAAAIALLDQYAGYFPGGTDELYWLYGQFYEANTPSRNILLSLDYYRRLVNEYPQSSRCNDARRRIAYLERFYINIQ